MPLEIIIALLTGLAVIAIGGAYLAARATRRAPVEARLRALESPVAITGAAARSGAGPVVDVLNRVGEAVSSKNTSNTLREQLALAGFHNRAAPAIFLGAKMVLFLLGVPLIAALVLGTSLPGPTKFLIVFVGAGVLFFVPNLYLAHCRELRRAEVRVHLPDAIDLLEISVSAGMGLDQAWNSVAAEVRGVSTILADEMALTNLEIHLGASRAVAMRHMAQRTGSSDLNSLVAILLQSERFGTSVSDALRTFANSMRENRSQRAQEYVEKMAVKLIFPMVGLIFPAVVIVMAGPAFMGLLRVLGN